MLHTTYYGIADQFFNKLHAHATLVIDSEFRFSPSSLFSEVLFSLSHTLCCGPLHSADGNVIIHGTMEAHS